MNNEPVYTIGLLITSTQAAVVALVTVLVLAMDLDPAEPLGAALIGAGATVTLAIGNLVGYYLTRQRVSPVSPVDRLQDGE